MEMKKSLIVALAVLTLATSAYAVDNPTKHDEVAQALFRSIVGQWPVRVLQHTKDRLPVKQKFHTQRMRLFM